MKRTPTRRRAARHAEPSAPASGTGRRGRVAPDGVSLAWARDRDGRLAAARSLDETTRRSRAPFACPGCGDEVVPHLGARKARHFAHRPGSTCPLTSPETALHFNAKARLLVLCEEAFRGDRRVTLLTRCAACRRTDPRDLASLGDEAAAEGSVGLLRADVLVRRGGAPALALEVLVTHAVDAAKEAALAAAGVPAVEVDARDEWEREATGGAVEVVCERTLGFPACPACQTVVRADADRARGGESAEIAELESYRARGLLGERVMRHVKSASRQDDLDPVPGSWKPGAPPDPESFDASFDAEAPFSGSERDALAARFRCPECRAPSLLWGSRLARHACPGQPPRPVAWRGYDGRLTELGWWKR